MSLQDSIYRRLYGPRQIGVVVARLLKQSCWIEITPLPEDIWEVAVKADAAQHLPIQSDLPPEAILSIKELEGLGYQLYEDGPNGFQHYWVNRCRQSIFYHTTQANAQDDAIADAFNINTLHRCNNCGRLHTDKSLLEGKDLAMRVGAESTLPSGKCACGALCYPIPSRTSRGSQVEGSKVRDPDCPACQVLLDGSEEKAPTDKDEWKVVGVSERVLFSGTKPECEKWVADGNVGGGYSIEH